MLSRELPCGHVVYVEETTCPTDPRAMLDAKAGLHRDLYHNGAPGLPGACKSHYEPIPVVLPYRNMLAQGQTEGGLPA